ncbi:undecaprenyl-diphosphate phosphatase [Actinomycetospora sp. TBRC 11914]|uniref:undecaprenyl-diphosphate phosphatase n=1 Tax=Actinomycetospora sp. TBRC 11914 TaxID=2729387 RepID=UPI00145F17ED|nr:undecaprenyl-diphosphate phosphatase [Actinomycetospora sp. TBRC 11914]NMO92818.1 undecaprenyl-diphosphate phosphatase [Actinomycetospora sp. TBRC 11914]
MSWLEALVLGLVQGLTEFLPISSSAHLRIVAGVFFGNDAGAPFTAVTQLGTEAAVLIYFWPDIWRLVTAWVLGLLGRRERGLDYRLAWYVIIGTLPISILGVLFKDAIEGPARNLWLIGASLVLFGVVLGAAEKYGRQRRPVEDLTLRDGVLMGCAQALALLPGVSRSGGTVSAGLFLGLQRPAAVRFSFLLAIPAVTAAGLFSLPDIADTSGPGAQPSPAQMVVATLVAFAVGYASIAWLLRYVEQHTVYLFVWYRVILGLLVLLAVSGGMISAT